ncbi:Transposon Ty3-G Gag-Pol polyprotein [Aphis craccivora]|uniref:RNA-directed DNA polymerase n=1 Tax=Aphis craccivora TaxID=307492 RepID=A0A6G0ZC68_APHCR|nr:Transposon Ty3-G Gag-Pol polyprotein [Aphis craccivora]
MYEIFNKRQTGRNKQASVASEPQQLATRTDDSGIRFSDVKDALSPFTGDNDCTADETLLQFVYRMRKLAKQGMVPDDLLKEYVIGGIKNKTILYGDVSIDYFKLKLGLRIERIITDRYPLPLIDYKVNRLRGEMIFNTLDLRSGFFRVPVEESSIKYTAFITPKRQYEFLRTPFGLCISPPVFQRQINLVFRDLIRSGQLDYMDDLVVVTTNLDEGMSRLNTFMNIVDRSSLDINCQNVKEKIAAAKHFPLPKNVKSVQSFLGLTGYFRGFVHEYSLISKLLSNLLKQGAVFQMGMEHETAVNQLKKCLTEAQVLRIYNQELNDNDNQLNPVCFMSRKTTEAQQKYHSYVLEVLAIT